MYPEKHIGLLFKVNFTKLRLLGHSTCLANYFGGLKIFFGLSAGRTDTSYLLFMEISNIF